MRSSFKFLLPVLTFGLMVLASGHAQAIAVVPTTQTFNFSGNCLDCAQAAHADNSEASSTNYAVSATLVLQDYAVGISTFDLGNFVSFTYSGSNKAGSSFTWLASALEMDDVHGFFSGSFDHLTFLVNLVHKPDSFGNSQFFVGPTTVDDTGIVYDFNFGVLVGSVGGTKDFGTGTWSTAAPLLTDPNQIPEPGSLLLVGGALAALGLARRRKA